MAVNINRGWYVEQALVVIVGTVSMILSIFQVRAHSIWRDQCKPLHRKLHPTIFAGSVLALIWSVDPHGLYKVYPWYILGFMKDHQTVFLFFCGTVWLTQVVKVLFEVNNRAAPKQLELFLSRVPSVLIWFVIVIADCARVATNAVWPAGFITAYISIATFLFALAVFRCIKIVHDTNKAVASKVNESQQAARTKVMRKLFTGGFVCLAIAIFQIYQSYQTFSWVGYESDNQVPVDPSHYAVWNNVILWFVVDIALFYVSWLPILRKPEPVPVASSETTQPHRGSKIQQQRGSRVQRESRGSSVRKDTGTGGSSAGSPSDVEIAPAMSPLGTTISSDGSIPAPSLRDGGGGIAPIREATAENLQPI